MKSENSLRTPLAKVRGLGSARSGTEHFWKQRLTAAANVPLAIAFVWIVASLAGADQGTVIRAIAHPVAGLLLALFVGSGIVHMRLGMQTIIEDYVPAEGVKLILLMLNTFFCIAVAAACLWALLKISFGM